MPDIAIVATALVTPVGLRTAQTCASVRAGISRLSAFKWNGNTCRGLFSAAIPDGCLAGLSIDPGTDPAPASIEKRILRLVGSTAGQLSQLDLDPVPLVIGLGNGFEHFNDRDILAMAARQLGVATVADNSAVIKQGRAAGLMAIGTACDMLAAQKADKVLTGGVDSFHDVDLLGRLNIENRMKSPTAKDGFIPGEGAALLLLMEKRAAEKRQYPILGVISAWAAGFEPGHLASDKPCLGTGLCETFQKLFDGRSSKKIATIYASMNAQSYWAKEFSAAYLRFNTYFKASASVHHPAQYYGDPGAASGAIMTALAATGIDLGYQNSPALVYASSDYGQRCAVIVNSKGEY
jgi:3-oxoacyl-[acyl-carrier-protein] synthase I